MSTKAVAWALEQRVGNPTAKLVLLGYAEHAGRESWVAWPSRETVGVYAEVEIRQAHRLHNYLVDHGFIAVAEPEQLTAEERERWSWIRADRRPRLWLVNPSRGVADDMSSLTYGVSSTAPRGVTDPPHGVSSDDNRTVIPEPSSKPRERYAVKPPAELRRSVKGGAA